MLESEWGNVKIEKKLCEFCEKHVMVLTFILISVAGLLVRIPLYPFISGDMEFSILQFLIIPLMMEVVCIPAMFVGRGIKAAFSVYYYQTKSCTKLFFSYPSFWAIFVDHTSGKVAAVEYMRTSIVLLTVMVLAGLMVYLIRQKVAVEGENVLYIGFLMIYTCVLFLPGMHDRYGYGYEILALPIALKHKKTIPLYLGLMFLDLVIYGQEFFDGLDVGRTMGLANTVIYLLYVYYLTRVMLGRRDTSK